MHKLAILILFLSFTSIAKDEPSLDCKVAKDQCHQLQLEINNLKKDIEKERELHATYKTVHVETLKSIETTAKSSFDISNSSISSINSTITIASIVIGFIMAIGTFMGYKSITDVRKKYIGALKEQKIEFEQDLKTQKTEIEQDLQTLREDFKGEYTKIHYELTESARSIDNEMSKAFDRTKIKLEKEIEKITNEVFVKQHENLASTQVSYTVSDFMIKKHTHNLAKMNKDNEKFNTYSTYTQCIDVAQKVIDYAEELDDLRTISWVNAELALIHYYEDQFIDALKAQLKAADQATNTESWSDRDYNLVCMACKAYELARDKYMLEKDSYKNICLDAFNRLKSNDSTEAIGRITALKSDKDTLALRHELFPEQS